MISVIVPVYNAENYIDACIHSILTQSYKDFEIILVDDGSTDKSGIIIDTYAEEDDRIRAFHVINKGAAAARNYGVSKAEGRWICFIDADDTIEPDYLKYLIDMRNEFESDIAVCGYRNIYNEEDLNEPNSEKIREAMTGVEAMEDLLYQKHFMSVPWGCISNRKIWDTVSFPEGTKAEDMGTIYRMYAASGRVAYGDRKLYNYFQRKNNTIYSTSNERNIDYYKHSRRMIDFVRKNYPDSLLSAYSRHFSACFQILSETRICSKTKKYRTVLYKDIRTMQLAIIKDKKGKPRNRIASLLSLISVRGMHLLLRIIYKLKLSKVK